jgi:hypothetical protein
MATDETDSSRRDVLRLTGTSLAALGGTALATIPASAIPSLSVYTDGATNVCSCSATLNGDLEYIGDNDFVKVYFEWGEKGTGLPNTTSGQWVSTTGPFSEDITDLNCTTYEFRAVASSSDDYDDGEVLEFTVQS